LNTQLLLPVTDLGIGGPEANTESLGALKLLQSAQEETVGGCIFTRLVTASLSSTLVPFCGTCFLSHDGGVCVYVHPISAHQHLRCIHFYPDQLFSGENGLH